MLHGFYKKRQLLKPPKQVYNLNVTGTEDTATVLCSKTNLPPLSWMMLPVEVSDSTTFENKIKINVGLDTASDSSMLAPSIAEYLNLVGEKKVITINTVTGTREKNYALASILSLIHI